MNFAGIITEYDPFHNGHAAQLAMLRARGAKTIAVCMSAGAVQRGGLPLLPESPRVEAALHGGADLVVALPGPYASASAEGFAAAGVALLAALGCDTLAFGAETPDQAQLLQTAALLQSTDFSMRLRNFLDDGVPFAAARAQAAELLQPGAGALLASPNNILGVEYCKAILAQCAPLEPLPLPRLGAAHGGSGTGVAAGAPVASASALRQRVTQRGLAALEAFVPPRAYALYQTAVAAGELVDNAKFSTAILAMLRGKSQIELATVRGVGEGLDYRLGAAVRSARDVEGLYAALQTKRYPTARLRRLVLDAALGTPPCLSAPPYLHVLGARRAVLPLLKNAALPASTSLAELEKRGAACQQIAKLHSKAVDFSALCRQQTMPMGLAYTVKPVVL